MHRMTVFEGPKLGPHACCWHLILALLCVVTLPEPSIAQDSVIELSCTMQRMYSWQGYQQDWNEVEQWSARTDRYMISGGILFDLDHGETDIADLRIGDNSIIFKTKPQGGGLYIHKIDRLTGVYLVHHYFKYRGFNPEGEPNWKFEGYCKPPEPRKF